MKYETDCKIHFAISCKSKINGIKTCEIDLEDGYTLTYMPIPDDVRFCFSSITRFYKSEEGQKIIRERLTTKFEIVIHNPHATITMFRSYENDISKEVYDTLSQYGIAETTANECARWCELASCGDSYNTEEFDVYVSNN